MLLKGTEVMNWGDIPANTNIGNFPTSGNVIGDTDQQTLTNKRINPRVGTANNRSSMSPNVSTTDILCASSQGQTLTINASSGSPVKGNMLRLKILDNGSGGDPYFGLGRSYYYEGEKRGYWRLTRIRERGKLRGVTLIPYDAVAAFIRNQGRAEA